jgi:hypothetical protein
VLAALLAILRWQCRYTWSIGNPMYGWPIPFNNVWHHDGWEQYGWEQWRPWLLALDATVWLILLASVGYTLERWRRRKNLFQFNLGGLFILQAVLAALNPVSRLPRGIPNFQP